MGFEIIPGEDIFNPVIPLDTQTCTNANCGNCGCETNTNCGYCSCYTSCYPTCYTLCPGL